MNRAGRAEGARPAPSYSELIRTYLGISLLGFGGPNAHLALMLDEVVERRRWLSRERFLELMAVTNLLPGPNSSEVAIHVGYTQRGWRGALATGLAFLLPTFVIVTALSALYFRYGSLPEVATIFWGLQPVIVAIVVAAGVKIGRAGVRNGVQGVLAVAGAAVSLVSGQAIIAAMLVGGAVTWWWGRRRSGSSGARGAGARGADGGHPGTPRDEPPAGAGRPAIVFVPLALSGVGWGAGGFAAVAAVFWLHLWIGSVLFGGGYVLVALLEPYAVGGHGWLTSAQFLDGVALTQAVPGPISTLSAFVGYAAAGVPGAVAGTLGVYLPAFSAVLLSAPRLERIRTIGGVQDALEGVVAVVAGAVLGVGVTLALAGVRDPIAAVIAVGALTLALWRRTPSLWLVAGGLAAGVVRALLFV